MTNDNKNINELVIDDDDPTVELESLADTFGLEPEDRDDDLPTGDELQSDLRNRAATIEQLQYDIEQLRMRCIGLETELKEREELTRDLNAKLASAGDPAEVSAAGAADEQLAGRLAAASAAAQQWRDRLAQAEAYADELRRRLQERTEFAEDTVTARDTLKRSLDRSTRRADELELQVGQLREKNASLEDELARIRDEHEEEIRLIRFELGEAQETMAQQELVTEQLASDLVDTRGFRDELEKMLTQTEEESGTRISDLEREIKRLRNELAHNRETLDSKNEAINCLLAELTRKSQQLESVGEIDNVIHEVDHEISEHIDERVHRDRDRISRVLIGTVDGQELRFPLFKDRLTIGRTEQNDIQLKASFVSRRHAVIVVDHDTTRVIDWGSKNGVFVNSERITEHFLKNGDSVRIGTAEFRYEERPKRDH
jgi:chromosome segregation ATPase